MGNGLRGTLVKEKSSSIHRSKGGSEDKESACNAEDLDLIPGSGRCPVGGNGNPSSVLAWRIPWIEEAGRLQSLGSQKDTTEQLTHKGQIPMKAS